MARLTFVSMPWASGTAIAIMIANVPQLVPVENAMKQATRKISAGTRARTDKLLGGFGDISTRAKLAAQAANGKSQHH